MDRKRKDNFKVFAGIIPLIPASNAAMEAAIVSMHVWT